MLRGRVIRARKAEMKGLSATMSITIRPANSREFHEFHRICDNDLPHPLTLEERLEQRRQEFEQIDQDERVAFFAEIEGNVEGSVQLCLRDKTEREGRIHALVVRRKNRRRGIGSRLIDAVEEDASHRGYNRIWLTVHRDNDAAICLYQKKGFIEISSDRSSGEDEMLEMAKVLESRKG